MDPHVRTPRLWRRGNGIYYLLYYHTRLKKQTKVSLGTDVRREALKKKRALIREGFNPFETEAAAPTVGAAMDRYFTSRKARCTEATVRDLRSFKDLFVAHCGADRPLDVLDHETIEAYYFQEHLKAATKHGYYRRVKAFLNWCAKQDWLSYDFVRRLEAPSTARRHPAFLSKSAFKKLDEHFIKNEPWMSGVIGVAVATGCRLSELQRMRWRDIDREGGFITVIGKGNKERYVPLWPFTSERLARLNPTGEHVLSAPGEPQIPYYKTSKRFKAGVRMLKLSERLSFHSLRHTFASWLVQDGIPLARIAQWMGHSSIQITQRYAHLKPKTRSGSPHAFQNASLFQ